MRIADRWGYLKQAIFGPSQGLSDSNHWITRTFGARTDAGVSVSESNAMCLPAVYGAVGIVADAIGMVPASVVVVDESGQTVNKMPGHPVTKLLNRRANPFMSPYVYRQTSQAHCMLWGNAYSFIQRNQIGQAIELWPTLPAGAQLVNSNVDSIRPELEYRLSVNGQTFTAAPDEVLHVRALGQDGYTGLSPIALARQAVGWSFAMQSFGAKFFANEAKSGGFITHPENISDQAMHNLLESLNSQGGLEHAHAWKVLEEGMKVQSITIPPEDAQFLQSREFGIAEIARLYRIPLVLLQSHEKTTSWGSGIEQLMIGFVQWTLAPWLAQWQQEATFKLLTTAEQARGLQVRFDPSRLLQGDMATRSQYYERLVKIGAITRNEVRIDEGRNPIPGLDDQVMGVNPVGIGDER